ncbi:MAG: type II toxin-antitoxin system death-on-curing family toxin [Chloroflexota bacterium]|nr:type II toxin-antitoxin system death-on-curing family toxin [Chloroflexota bacterium]
MSIRFLPEAIVLTINEDQIRLYGGLYGVRDAAALDSALHMPQAQLDGQYLHTTIIEMAAAYGFHICQNHPFLDGNKRTAGMVMFTFLQLNNLMPVATEMGYYSVMMAVASGQMSKAQLADWLKKIVRETTSNTDNAAENLFSDFL